MMTDEITFIYISKKSNPQKVATCTRQNSYKQTKYKNDLITYRALRRVFWI